MASPQTENGYTRIANELLEQIYLYGFTRAQFALILWLIRETYGWNRKSTIPKITTREIGEKMRESKTAVALALKVLVEANVIIVNNDRSLSLNKDYELWGRDLGGEKEENPAPDSGHFAPVSAVSCPEKDVILPRFQTPYKEKDSKDSKDKLLTADAVKHEPKKGGHFTPSQFIIRVFKEAKGIDANDRAWDKLFAARFVRSANDLLRAFGGDAQAAGEFILQKGDEWTESGLQDWGLDAVVRAAAKEYTSIVEDANGSKNVEMGANRSLAKRTGPAITHARDITSAALDGLRQQAGGPGDGIGQNQ